MRRPNAILHISIKGVVYCFLICMIVFMGYNITCIRGFSFLKSLIFQKFHLYCKPLSPLSFERPVDYETTPSETGNGLRLVSWVGVL